MTGASAKPSNNTIPPWEITDGSFELASPARLATRPAIAAPNVPARICAVVTKPPAKTRSMAGAHPIRRDARCGHAAPILAPKAVHEMATPKALLIDMDQP